MLLVADGMIISLAYHISTGTKRSVLCATIIIFTRLFTVILLHFNNLPWWYYCRLVVLCPVLLLYSTFNENEFLWYSRQHTTAVNYSFVHWTKNAADCCQMSILQNSQKKMFSNENSETAIFCEISLRIWWYFFQISVIKIELPTGKKDINLDKKVIQHWFFAICWIERILNYPIYDNFNMSPTLCKNFRQIAQIDYLWCGYE